MSAAFDFDGSPGNDDAALRELEPEVVAFARALADAGEHGEAAVLLGDVVDQLLNENGLADAGAAEQAGLAALRVRLEQVDDFDAGLENLDVRRLLVEPRRITMDRPVLLRVDRTFVVDRFAEDVEDAAEGLAADGDGDRTAGVDGLHAAHHSVRRLHGDAAHLALADVVGDFGDDVDRHLAELAVVDDADRVVDRRKVTLIELDVERRSDDLDHLADLVLCCGFLFCHVSPVAGLRSCRVANPATRESLRCWKRRSRSR